MRARSIIILLAVVSVFSISCAKSSSDPTKNIYRSTGTVKAIDRQTTKVTIDHKDIPGYMTAMEMAFVVARPEMLDGFKPGDIVAFELERSGSTSTITKIDKTGETIAGSEIYKTNCAVCHGENGGGEKRGIPLISGHALAHSEEEYIKQVENGSPGKMLPFRDKLSPEEIRAVVKYVREEMQKGIDRNAGHKH